MTSLIALLRGINVGGNKAVGMADLRQHLKSLGYGKVRTLLQSGNVVFESKTAGGERMEKLLEREIEKKFGHTIDFFLRDAKEWRSIIDGNPFHEEAVHDPGRLLIMCLKAEPSSKALASLKAAIVGREFFFAKGRCLYLVYPDGSGRSRLTHKLIESKLETRGTARNWNTARKIAALIEN